MKFEHAMMCRKVNKNEASKWEKLLIKLNLKRLGYHEKFFFSETDKTFPLIYK